MQKKLSKKQNELLQNIQDSVKCANEFNSYEEFYDNCEMGRQNYLSIGATSNMAYRTSEQVKQKDLEYWNKNKKLFKEYQDGIMLIHAKTETIRKIEELGYIKILEKRNSLEKIQLLVLN